MSEHINWIILQENQQATYIVNEVFDYYLFLNKGSSVTFKAANPSKSIILRKNIWGPGNVTIDGGNVTVGDLGVAPALNLLTPKSYTYTAPQFTEVI